MRKPKFCKWGRAWENDYFSLVPRGVAAVMRDAMGMNVQEICVMQALVSFRDSQSSMVVWSPLTTIADRTGMSKDAVGRAIRQLMERGWIVEAVAPHRDSARRYDIGPFLKRLAELRPADTEVRKERS